MIRLATAAMSRSRIARIAIRRLEARVSGRVMTLEGTHALAVAAVVYEPGSRIEEFFAALAVRLQAEGIAVSGLLQHSLRAREEDRCSFEMEDLGQGVRFRISQDLGTGSSACSIDHAAIASASVVLRRAILDAPDVVMVNKFGALEAAGEGLREEMNAIVAAGLPMLTTVNREQIDDWRAYVGTPGAELPMDLDVVVGWVRDRASYRGS